MEVTFNKYLDKKKKQVLPGDLLFYRESEFRGADSLLKVVQIDEELYSQCVVHIEDGKYILSKNAELDPLYLYVGSRGTMFELFKLTDVDKDDLIGYMNNKYPLE